MEMTELIELFEKRRSEREPRLRDTGGAPDALYRFKALEEIRDLPYPAEISAVFSGEQKIVVNYVCDETGCQEKQKRYSEHLERLYSQQHAGSRCALRRLAVPSLG